MKIHHPPHLFIDNTYYFLTARTYRRQKFFYSDSRKAILLHSLKAEFRKRGLALLSWVVMDNHYHVLFRVSQGRQLSKAINMVHGRVSYILNRENGTRGRKVFQNYWDRCIRNEKDFYTRLNYIHYNPVKHGSVYKMEDYGCSRYRCYLQQCGHE